MSEPQTIQFNLPCRCCVPLRNVQSSCFLVTSNSTIEENEIYLVEYDSVSNAVEKKNVYSHSSEIRYIASSPFGSDLIIYTSSVSKHNKTPKVVMYSLKDNFPSNKLKEKFVFPSDQLSFVLLSPSAANTLYLLSSDGLSTWNEDGGNWVQTSSSSFTATDNSLAAAAHKSHPDCVATGNGKHIYITDVRANKISLAIANAHVGDVKCLDFSSSTQYRLASGGSDGCVNMYDIRNANYKLFSNPNAHDHWVESMAYNTDYESLLLTSSSDKTLKVWNVQDIKQDSDSVGLSVKPVEKTSLDDSLHSCCWSAHEPSVYMAVSHSGIISFNTLSSKVQLSVRTKL